MADETLFFDMLRAAPFEHAVLTIIPGFVGLSQIANSVFTDLSFAISIPFALVMVGFAGILTQYNVAQFRREQLEREWIGVP